MPTFFQALGRILQGKPVFDTTESSHTAAHGEPHTAQIEKNNESTFPVVLIEKTDSHEHHGTLEVHCAIKNESHHEVLVDKIFLLNKTQELNLTLQPEQEKHVLVYRGPSLTQQLSSEAKLDYKTAEGDYFQAVHEVRYAYTSANTYEVTGLQLRPPIRDIFG